MVTRANGHAERETAKAMIGDVRQAVFDEQTEITLGADKGYDAQEFIEACLVDGRYPAYGAEHLGQEFGRA